MENDTLYKERLNILMNNHEVVETILSRVRNILPQLSQKTAFLDIGPGQGDYTIPLSEYFHHVGIVETNQLFCSELVNKLFQLGKVVTAYNGIWQEAEIGEQKYDLILSNHMLYYIEKPDLAASLQKMLRSLAPGGKIVIVLAIKESQTGQPLFRQFLSTEDVVQCTYAEDVVECFNTLGIACESMTMDIVTKKETLDEFIQCIALMMQGYIDVKELRDKSHLINQAYKTEQGYQIIETTQFIIV